jgi:hypothetical protein
MELLCSQQIHGLLAGGSLGDLANAAAVDQELAQASPNNGVIVCYQNVVHVRGGS